MHPDVSINYSLPKSGRSFASEVILIRGKSDALVGHIPAKDLALYVGSGSENKKTYYF